MTYDRVVVWVSLYLLMLSFVGCRREWGPAQNAGQNNLSQNISNTIQNNREISDTELEIAHAICDALEHKRVNFTTQFLDNLIFKIKEENCDDSSDISNIVELAPVIDEATNRPTFVSSYSGNFFSTVETDETSQFIRLCQQLSRNQRPRLVIKTGLDSANLLEFKIYSQQYSIYRIKHVTLDADQNYFIAEFREYYIDTLSDNNKGLVAIQRYYKNCPAGSARTQYKLSQEFIR
jgi:hypothetical protein